MKPPARIRIGAVAYLNTRPLVLGMEQGLGADRIDLSYGVPAVLAERMAAGDLDIALLPIIELGRIPDLEVVPGLGIVTRGASRSVLLVSKKPIEHVRSVALDVESRTSNALTRVLFAEVWRSRPEFVDVGNDGLELEAALARCDAAVRIGDKALFAQPLEGALAHDLGTVWTDFTGLPFVFAAWIARRGTLDRETYSTLHQSHRAGSRSIDLIAEDYTWRGKRDPEVVRRYLTDHIYFRLGTLELRAIDTFLGLAARHGIIERAPVVRLAYGAGPDCHASAAEVRRSTV